MSIYSPQFLTNSDESVQFNSAVPVAPELEIADPFWASEVGGGRELLCNGQSPGRRAVPSQRSRTGLASADPFRASEVGGDGDLLCECRHPGGRLVPPRRSRTGLKSADPFWASGPTELERRHNPRLKLTLARRKSPFAGASQPAEVISIDRP